VAFFLTFFRLSFRVFLIKTKESSRRDDLESLAYMLINFLRGTLPWRKIRAPDVPPVLSSTSPSEQEHIRQHYNPVSATWDLIRDAKVANEEVLTLGLPPEFDVLYRYARSLEFDDLPDYEGLRKLFRGLAERAGIVYDGVYDWTVPPSKGSSSTQNVSSYGRRSTSDGSGGHRRHCEACNAKRRLEP
jgi:casein kinase I family protein HRR25